MNYHLLSRDSSLERSDREYSIDSNLGLMKELVREKVDDPQRILRRCASLRREKAGNSEEVSIIIGRVVSYWREDRYGEALSALEGVRGKRAHDEFHRDLECMLGRALLRVTPPKLEQADAAFRRAYEKGCIRPELIDLWLEARDLRKDWIGVINLTEMALRAKFDPKWVIQNGRAYIKTANLKVESGDYNEAINEFVKAGLIFNSAIANKDLIDYFEVANELRRSCFIEAVRWAKVTFRSDMQIIEIWQICSRAFDSFVRVPFVLSEGLNSALRWAEYVRRFRDAEKDGDLQKINEIIGKISRMIDLFYEKDWSNVEIRSMAEHVVARLIQIRDQLEPASL